MDHSDARMNALLGTTQELHRSMTLRAEEAERHVKQLTQELERRDNLHLGEQIRLDKLKYLTLHWQHRVKMSL